MKRSNDKLSMQAVPRMAEAHVEGPVFRLEVELEIAPFAPALEFDQAIALAGGMALGQGKSAGLGEYPPEEDRLVVNIEVMPLRNFHERRVADKGPWAHEGEIIVDRTGHGGNRFSGAGRVSASLTHQGRFFNASSATRKAETSGDGAGMAGSMPISSNRCRTGTKAFALRS